MNCDVDYKAFSRMLNLYVVAIDVQSHISLAYDTWNLILI